jgi:3-oxoacyl-[acyl-carrier protein] reductase
VDLGIGGRVAWVLGASSGLGRACATALAGEGARVAISARREELLKEIAADLSASGGECVAVPVDVTDPAAIAAGHSAVASELGPVNILVANAGGPPPGGFEEVDDAQFEGAFALTTASAWHLANLVVPAMKEHGSGCIVFVTSSATKEIIPTLLLSNMMRAAVVGLAKTMSKELGPHGIRVLCVAPGRIDTARVQSLDEATAESSGRTVQEVRAASESQIPLQRYGEPKEFGEVVAFLASERASYLTGITVAVDGGALDGILS